MKNIRVALLTAGALVALVGGAETANWGLTPLTASLNATAPQIITSGASPLDNSGPGADWTISPSSGVPTAFDATPVSYRRTPSPPMDTDSDVPRPDNVIQADAPATAKSTPAADLGRDGVDTPSSEISIAGSGSPAPDNVQGESTAIADGAASIPSVRDGPD